MIRPRKTKLKSRPPLPSGLGLISHCQLLQNGRVVGFIYDAERPERRFTVEVLLDELVVAACHADKFVPELFAQHIGDGSYGFMTDIASECLTSSRILSIKLANLGGTVGSPIDLTESREASRSSTSAELRWLGGLRFIGWVDSQADQILHAIVDGQIVLQVRVAYWTCLDANVGIAASRNVRGFDFHLPERFADGRVHSVNLRYESGEPVPAVSTFVAFPDGLAQTLASLGIYASEQLRGKLYDQLIPASLPLADYARWRERFPQPATPACDLELAVIVLGSSGSEKTLMSLQCQLHVAWTAGVIDGPAFAVAPTSADEFLQDAASRADIVLVVLAGTELYENALTRIADAFNSIPEAKAVYADLDHLTIDGQLWPVAFPAFDYERMLEQGYCAHLFALRRDVAIEALRTKPVNVYRLFNAMLDRSHPQQRSILHLPGAIATMPKLDLHHASDQLRTATVQHLCARAVDARVETATSDLLPAVKVLRQGQLPTLTVIIPTRDRVGLLRTCLESIAPAVERTNADILVLDNESSDRATLEYLNTLSAAGVRVLRVEGPFNFARINNRAVEAVTSDVLCLLNNDVEAKSDDWLVEMLARASEPDVGAVGALLTWPGGIVQHGGVVLGVNFAATHAFTDRQSDDPGYCELLRVAHECSAVTAACLVTRRADYVAVGGMDEIHFGVAFNDVDYCLKLRQSGKRIVFTPHVRLVHAESASRGRDHVPEKKFRFERELEMLRARWGDFLLHDPSYNPQLSRDGVPYRALAWPPGSLTPRFNELPRSRHLPPGF